MGDFNFPLEKILDYRRSIEKQKQEVLAQNQKKQKKLEKDLNTIKSKYNYYTTKPLEQKINITMASQQLAYLECLRIEIENKTNEVNKAKALVQSSINDLTKAMLDKKVLEKVKQKQEKAFYADLNRKELAQLDETAIIRYSRTK